MIRPEFPPSIRLLFCLSAILIGAACTRPAPPTATPTLRPSATPSPTSTNPPPPTLPPLPTATASKTTPPPTTAPTPTARPVVFMPVLQSQPRATGYPAPEVVPPATKKAATAVPPSPVPQQTELAALDFSSLREELASEGRWMTVNKIGFHTGIGGNSVGLGDWMRQLDDAGAPFFLKSVDNAGPLFDAQQLIYSSGLPHTLVYRRSGNEYDTPNYSLPAAEAAEAHWALHRAVFPPELDRNLIWVETINEVDKNFAPWLGEFAFHSAQLALRDGVKWAAFGWASGEPEAADWESPAMLDFLRLAAEHPNQIGVALHEYSYTTANIRDGYPYKIGRFQQLFQAADKHGIPRPTVLITEWGWAFDSVPDAGKALDDIAWAAELYAPYPQIKGAAVWYLGGGFAGIADQTQRLISPMTRYTLTHYFAFP